MHSGPAMGSALLERTEWSPMPVLGKEQGKAWREGEAVELDGIRRMQDLVSHARFCLWRKRNAKPSES